MVEPDFATLKVEGAVAAASTTEARTAVLDLQRELRAVLDHYQEGIAPVELGAVESGYVEEWNRDTSEYERLGYENSFAAEIRVDRLGLLDDLFHRLSELDGLRVRTPGFGVDDPDAALARARSQAMADARIRAEELAEAQGARIGPIWGVAHRARHQDVNPVRWMGTLDSMGIRAEAADLDGVMVTGSRFEPVIRIALQQVRFSAEVGVVYELLPGTGESQ